jgi:N-methylhydantoinase B
MGHDSYLQALQALNDYAARLAQKAMQQIPDGVYRFRDVMDDDGQGHSDLPIEVCIRIEAGRVDVDFSGTAAQVKGNINCPLSVAAAAVFYVFRCFMPDNAPACAGSFRHISLSAPVGSLLNAQRPAAVTAGNVETSSRVVDVVLGALAQAVVEKIPAASHGSMNNLAMGAEAGAGHLAWDYYETMGGGMGGNAQHDGLSGVQTHMTNTLNTPVEVLEMNYPLRLNHYRLRAGSAGDGMHRGGEGVERSYTLLSDCHVTVLSERRTHAPWGIDGGEIQTGEAQADDVHKANGAVGENRVNGKLYPAKFSVRLRAGDVVTIRTPGGGGYTG